MRVAIGADHAGFALKQHLIGCLAEAGHETTDLGTFSEESVDYPDFGRKVARAIVSGAAERGVAICGTGIGISIAANKVSGIRAARCTTEYDARFARAHNDANVLAIGARVTGFGLAEAILAAFFETEFEGGRHARRVERMED